MLKWLKDSSEYWHKLEGYDMIWSEQWNWGRQLWLECNISVDVLVRMSIWLWQEEVIFKAIKLFLWRAQLRSWIDEISLIKMALLKKGYVMLRWGDSFCRLWDEEIRYVDFEMRIFVMSTLRRGDSFCRHEEILFASFEIIRLFCAQCLWW